MIEHEIEVPLVYYFTYVPSRRHSKDLKATAVEQVKVSIREADAAEMPVAARHKVWGAPDGKESFRVGPDGFYTEVHDSRWSGRPSEYLLSQELREFSQQGQIYCNALFEGMERGAYEDFQRGHAIAPDSVAIIKSSKRDQAMDQLLQNAANLVVLDGRMWRRVEMPVYHISQGGSFFDTPYASVEIGPRSKFEDKAKDRIFPLNQFDEVKAYAAAHLNGGLDDDARAEIFIREAFDYDDVTPATLELLEKAAEQHRKDIGSFNKETAMVWYDFRDATAKALETHNEEDIEAAIACGRAYIQNGMAYDTATKRIEQAALRWEDRPMLAGMKI
jgi:hypothetical protein